MRVALVLLCCAMLTGCAFTPSPGLSLRDARVVEGPMLIERSGHIYLRYRRALEEGRFTLVSVLYHKKTADVAYYFFSGPISHIEWGNLVEHPLAYDQAEDFARKGKVFWLDPDGTTHLIPLKKEEPNQAPEPTAPSGRGSS